MCKSFVERKIGCHIVEMAGKYKYFISIKIGACIMNSLSFNLADFNWPKDICSIYVVENRSVTFENLSDFYF